MAFAYWMTGCVTDSEDIVQEVLANWYAGEQAHVADAKRYLAKAVKNRCLSWLQRRAPRRGTYLPEPLVHPVPALDAKLDLSFGLWLLLAELAPLERAVFLLKDGFGFDYEDLAHMLEVRADYCRQLYHRAGQHLQARRQRFTPSAEQQHRLLQAFGHAIETGDLAALTQLLRHDVRVYADGGPKRPAAMHPVVGPAACARYLLGIQQKYGQGLTSRLGRVNDSWAVLFYRNRPEALDSVMVLELDAACITALYLVLDPDKLPR